MGDIVRVLAQVAGIGALLLVMAAGYYLYKALGARKESRSALFNAERQSAGDRSIRAALSSMFLFGLALLVFGVALLGENLVPASPPPAVTPTSPRRTPGAASVTPAVVTAASPLTTAAAATPAAPAAPTATLTPVALATTATQPRKTAVVSGAGDNLLKLRRDPSTSADVIAQLPDGTVLEVLEGQQTNQGIVWQQVRDAQGNEGWVASQYLVYNP